MLLALVCIVVAFSLSSGCTKNDTPKAVSSSGSSGVTKTASPTPIPIQTFSIGDMVEIGDFQFTFNSAEWNTGGEYSFNSPEAGEKWLVVDCTIKNLDTESAPVSSLLMFSLYDANGYSKDRTLFADVDGSLDGELGSGRQMRGQLAYSVDSTDNGPWELVFDPSIYGYGQAIFGFSASDVR